MTFPNDFCVAQQSQGGTGGSDFSSFRAPVSSAINDGSIADVAYTVSKIECWVADHRMVGIKVWYSNTTAGWTETDTADLADFFGAIGGAYKAFQFDLGELAACRTFAPSISFPN